VANKLDTTAVEDVANARADRRVAFGDAVIADLV
jgi:hypothetical protein